MTKFWVTLKGLRADDELTVVTVDSLREADAKKQALRLAGAPLGEVEAVAVQVAPPFRNVVLARLGAEPELLRLARLKVTAAAARENVARAEAWGVSAPKDARRRAAALEGLLATAQARRPSPDWRFLETVAKIAMQLDELELLGRATGVAPVVEEARRQRRMVESLELPPFSTGRAPFSVPEDPVAREAWCRRVAGDFDLPEVPSPLPEDLR